MIAIATTDWEWFEALRARNTIENINFWTPTPWNVKKIKPGEKLYFLLKSPLRKIGGYGVFHHYENKTIAEAWANYGLSNGVSNLSEFIKRTSKYKKKNSNHFDELDVNPVVGCIILENPVFFENADFFDPEEYGFLFPRSVVKMKCFENDFENIQQEDSNFEVEGLFEPLKEDNKEYKIVSTKERKGQNHFRREVLRIYNNKCAITGETCIEVLEAAHIQPYINKKSNNLSNGICLRADIHILFDAGLISITDDYLVVVSDTLLGTTYTELKGKKIALPDDCKHYPSVLALKYHRTFCYRG